MFEITAFKKGVLTVGVSAALILGMAACGGSGNTGGNSNTQNTTSNTVNTQNNTSNTVPENNTNNAEPEKETSLQDLYDKLSAACAAVKNSGKGSIRVNRKASAAVEAGSEDDVPFSRNDVYETDYITDGEGRICFVRLKDYDESGFLYGQLQKDGLLFEYYLDEYEDGSVSWVEGAATENRSTLLVMESVLSDLPKFDYVENISVKENEYVLTIKDGFKRLLSEDAADLSSYKMKDVSVKYVLDPSLTSVMKSIWTFSETVTDESGLEEKNSVELTAEFIRSDSQRALSWFKDNTTYVRPEYSDITETQREYYINIPGVIIFDVRVPKIKDSLPGSESINRKIAADCSFELASDETSLRNAGYEEYSTHTLDYVVYRFRNCYEILINVLEGSAYGSGAESWMYRYLYDAASGEVCTPEVFVEKMGYDKERLMKEAAEMEDLVDILGAKLTDMYTYEELLDLVYFEEDGSLQFMVENDIS